MIKIGDIIVYTFDESERHLNNDIAEAPAIVTNILDNGNINIKIFTDASSKNIYKVNVLPPQQELN